MSINDTYFAIFLGCKTSPQMTRWNSLSEAERNARSQKRLAAWHAWVDQHRDAILGMGVRSGRPRRSRRRASKT